MTTNEEDFKPTIITRKDFDNFIEKLQSGEFDIKFRKCMSCSNEFIPNYHLYDCDECYFSRFPKEGVKKFFKSIIEEMFY